MTEIYIDGDACPVKAEVMRVADRHGLTVHLVSCGGVRLRPAPNLNQVVVAEGLDAADDWIAEHIQAGDIAITTDIPLAGRCVGKGARVVSPTGKALDTDSIGMAVAMRDLMTHLRDTGAATSHTAAFTKQNRSRFLQALEATIQALRRGR